ncbi:MAG TPA: hypothetical protein VMX35_05795 [Acidobacteriota bacterium]|nr:hypothetical protein [Acidobacteriota bacterium]
MWKLIKAELAYHWFWIALAYFFVALLSVADLGSIQEGYTANTILLLTFGYVMQLISRKTDKKFQIFISLPVGIAGIGATRILFDVGYFLGGYLLQLLVIFLVDPSSVAGGAYILLRLLNLMFLLVLLVNFIHDIKFMISGFSRFLSIFIAILLFFQFYILFTVPGGRIAGLLKMLGVESLYPTVSALNNSFPFLLTLLAIEIGLMFCTVALFTSRKSYLE